MGCFSCPFADPKVRTSPTVSAVPERRRYVRQVNLSEDIKLAPESLNLVKTGIDQQTRDVGFLRNLFGRPFIL